MRRNSIRFSQGIALLSVIFFLAGCTKDENITPQNLPIGERGGSLIGAPSTLLYGLSDQNEIVRFMSGPPATELSRVPISGLRAGEIVLAIDIRPATKQLYGVSSASLIYLIDPKSGFALPLSLIPFKPAIAGSYVGFDFDPREDRIRLVTDKEQNLRIDPITGAVSNIDFPLSPPLASINSIAYSATSFGLAASALYDIGLTEGKLYKQNPIAGTLTMVGSLGVRASGEGGFDISRNNTAFAVLFGIGPSGPGGVTIDTDPAYRLYLINLKSGLATNFGKVKPLIGLAIP